MNMGQEWSGGSQNAAGRTGTWPDLESRCEVGAEGKANIGREKLFLGKCSSVWLVSRGQGTGLEIKSIHRRLPALRSCQIEICSGVLGPPRPKGYSLA
jgi:hypothetical protein